jgi:hypothetical protein
MRNYSPRLISAIDHIGTSYRVTRLGHNVSAYYCPKNRTSTCLRVARTGPRTLLANKQFTVLVSAPGVGAL